MQPAGQLAHCVSRPKRFLGAHEEGSVGIQAFIWLSVLMGFVAFGLVTKLDLWPRLRILGRDGALVALVVPHTFRFVEVSFLAGNS